jgi:hypothetical protein
VLKNLTVPVAMTASNETPIGARLLHNFRSQRYVRINVLVESPHRTARTAKSRTRFFIGSTGSNSKRGGRFA